MSKENININKSQKIFIQSIYEKVSWEGLSYEESSDLVKYSIDHRFSSYLLDRSYKKSIKAEHLEVLKEAKRHYVYKKLALDSYIKVITNNLKENSIEHRFLKGTHLNSFAYKNYTDRFQRDIDILVKEADLRVTMDLLDEIGLKDRRNKHVDYQLNIKSRRHFPKLTNSTDTVSVEVHHRITNPIGGEEKCSLAESMLSSVDINSNLPVPKIEDTLLHLMLHACSQSRFSVGPQIFMDLNAVFKCYEIDVSYIKKKVEELNLEKDLHLCLILAERLGIENKSLSKLIDKQKVEIIDDCFYLVMNKQIIGLTNIFSYKYIKYNLKKINEEIDYFSQKRVKGLWRLFKAIRLIKERVLKKINREQISFNENKFIDSYKNLNEYLE